MRKAVVAVSMACVLAAGAAAAKDGQHPLFASDAPLTATLEAPWPDLLNHKEAPTRYPAKLTYTGADGQAHAVAGTVATRGLTRRRVCRFPPLKLRFEKEAVAGTDFAGQGELKLVTHCNTGANFDQYYVQEQLAYRIYNLFTDASFRTRPLEVTYRNPDGARPNGPHFAFLIEELGDVAKRNGLERDKRARLQPRDYDPAAMTRLALFEYLIGNTDWDVMQGPEADSCCHNTRALGGGGGAGLVPVPYDFDASGLVNTEYAAPDARLKIESVRERVFRGFCVHNDALPAARSEFQGKRAAIEALIRGEPRLDERHRRSMLAYVESFYATLGDDAKFAAEVTGKCRK